MVVPSGDHPVDTRLRAVELDVREIQTRLQACATKADIDRLDSTLRIWLLSGAVSALLLIVGWLFVWIGRLMGGAPS